jgi:DNA-binding winged helix-turn-helix (wHTH) protein
MQPAQQVSFDRYTVDLHNTRLWRGKRAIALTRQTFAVLRYLVEHAGQVVSKDCETKPWPQRKRETGLSVRGARSDEALSGFRQGWLRCARNDTWTLGPTVEILSHSPKAELFAALWPDTVVSDGALTFCIVELRKALGGSCHSAPPH